MSKKIAEKIFYLPVNISLGSPGTMRGARALRRCSALVAPVHTYPYHCTADTYILATVYKSCVLRVERNKGHGVQRRISKINYIMAVWPFFLWFLVMLGDRAKLGEIRRNMKNVFRLKGNSQKPFFPSPTTISLYLVSQKSGPFYMAIRYIKMDFLDVQ